MATKQWISAETREDNQENFKLISMTISKLQNWIKVNLVNVYMLSIITKEGINICLCFEIMLAPLRLQKCNLD